MMAGESPARRKAREWQVEVQAIYLDKESRPDANRYTFAYTVRMRNTGLLPAKLLGRRWLITDGNGKTMEVVGEGVVGAHPHLQPGQCFEYTSSATIETPVGCMQGSYQLLADDGIPFEAPIGLFRLSTGKGLH